MPDYYAILGIGKEAPEKEVRQAFRRLARQYHPDVNKNDESAEEKFKEINEAYSVLNDPDSRQKYDRYGDNWKHAGQYAPTGGGGPFRRTAGRGGEDVFSGPFGGSRGRGGRSIFEDLGFFGGDNVDFRPPPTEHQVSVSLDEAFHGATRLLRMQDGRRLEVKIPAGVDNGSRVHIAPDGSQGGDFYLVVSVNEHRSFQRRGRDLYLEVEMPLDDAVLGAELSVPTLTGRVALTVPPETPNGRRFRLSGQGMPALGGTTDRGDLYATVIVKLPTGLSDEDREFFRKLRRQRTGGSGDEPPDQAGDMEKDDGS